MAVNVEKIVERILEDARERTRRLSPAEYLEAWGVLLAEVEVEIQAFKETQDAGG